MVFTNTQDVQLLIEDLKGLRVEHISRTPAKVNSADGYDLRFMTKLEAKRLSRKEIDSLIEYAESYTEEFEKNRYMFRKVKGCRFEMADFDETEALGLIKAGVEVLRDEIRRRG